MENGCLTRLQNTTPGVTGGIFFVGLGGFKPFCN